MLRQAQHERFAVEATDLVKDFSETRAVDGVSLRVPAGSIYGMLGPNGAGKTTTLRMLLGIIDPSSGTRLVLGRERPLEAAQEIGYLPEERGLYPAMHARDAIAFMGALRGLPIAEGRRRADAMLAEHNLATWGRKSIRSLSKGMAQTVQLLGTLIHKPRLIILDEPFAGLDAINQARLEELIRRQARDGRDDHLFDPCHRARRAAVRANRHYRGGQGRLRRPRRRRARQVAPDRPSSDPSGRRAVAVGNPERRAP